MDDLIPLFDFHAKSKLLALGAFDPASMAIISYENEEAFEHSVDLMQKVAPSLKGIHDIRTLKEMPQKEKDRLYRKLNEELSKYETDADWSDSMSACLTGTMNHELMHYWQSVSTPVGFFFSRAIFSQITIFHICIKSIIDYLGDNPLVRIPLYKWQTTTTDKGLKQRLQPFLEHWIALQQLILVIDGGTSITLSEVSPALDIIKEFPDFSNNNRGRILKSALLNRLYPDEPLCPTTASGYFLGTRALYESMARVYEFDHVGKELKEDEFQQYIATKLHGLYHETINAATARLKLNDWRQFRFVYCTLLDLALLSPIAPGYGEVLSGTSCWEDLHPGWRFSRSLDAVNEMGPKCYADLSYEILTEAICDKFKWPSPSEVATIGTELDKEGDTPLHDLHAKACRLRLDRPTVFSDSFQFIESLFWELPPPFVIKPMGVHAIMDKQTVSHLLMLHYDCCLMYQIMLEGKVYEPYRFQHSSHPFGEDPFEMLYKLPRDRFVPLDS